MCPIYSVLRKCELCQWTGCVECLTACHTSKCDGNPVASGNSGTEKCKCVCARGVVIQTEEEAPNAKKMKMTPLPKVFLSYSWSDGHEMAVDLDKQLSGEGYRVFRDEGGMG